MPGYHKNQARVSEMLLHSSVTILGYNAKSICSLDRVAAEEANHVLANCALVPVETFLEIKVMAIHRQSLSAVVSILLAVNEYCKNII